MKNLCLIFLIFFSINSFCQSNTLMQDSTSIKDTMPEFPGGTEDFRKYVGENFIYPKIARAARYTGKLIVKFAVLEDGKIKVAYMNHTGMAFHVTNLSESVKQTVIKALDAEVTDTFESSPLWVPGTHKGKKIIMYVALPFNLYVE